jgi:poly-gamma-glutamate synthesis protein (capsule biosynthesis protein)
MDNRIRQPNHILSILGLGVLCTLILNACGNSPQAALSSQESQPTPGSSPTAFQTLSATAAPAATETITPEQSPTVPPTTIWLSPALPDQLLSELIIPSDWQITGDKQEAAYLLDLNPNNPVSEWIYALAAPFPTLTDRITTEQLTAIWSSGLDLPEEMRALHIDPNTALVLTDLFGEPSDVIQINAGLDLEDPTAFSTTDWVIVPFNQLNPRWKVIEINGESPIRKDFSDRPYPLAVTISLTTPSVVPFPDAVELGISIPATNRDPQKMTTVIMTGVTALVRATAATMELYGNTHPGLDIRDWLIEADFTHINNEVPFAENCPAPQFQGDELVFCSRTKYIELLEDIGTDIVELAGDHFADWGPEAMLYTIDLYEERGWYTYGGGKNYDEGKSAILIEHNGNHLAFIGCNGKSKGYAQATSTNPGAVHCDYDWLYAEIQRLSQSGYMPIVTFQHEEVYTYGIPPIMREDFIGASQAGALIVSGSQAHQPHAFEFTDTGLIHYGLGNLFFDQIYIGNHTRRAFIDRHVFYDGEHISTELLTIIFIDYARARPMTDEERIELLRTIFSESFW